jgi:hypothetical protein
MMRSRLPRARAVLFLAVAAYPGALWADRYYVGPANGSWNNAANWSTTLGGPGGAGVPGANEFVYLRNSDAIDRNIALDVSTPNLARVRLGNSSTGLTTLIQSGDVSLSSVAEFEGSNSTGVNSSGVHTQSAGLNTITWFLDLGDDPGNGTGTYNLSDSGSMIFNGTAVGAPGSKGLFVGYNENGVFNQNGGTVAVGTATTSVPLIIGNDGQGNGAGTGVGTYNLSDGALTVIGTELIGNFGSGTFIQSGGTHVSDLMEVAAVNGSTGNYRLIGGALNVANEFVGYAGNGTFNQSGGSHAVAGNLVVGYNASGVPGVGTYRMSGGDLAVAGNELIGYKPAFGGTPLATGTFNQTGGTNTIGTPEAPATLSLGQGPGPVGTYLLSGTGNLLVNGSVLVGNSTALGPSAIRITGGNMTATGPIQLTNGVLTLLGGTLSAGTIDTLGAPSRLQWSAGTLDLETSVILDPNLLLGSSLNLPVNKALVVSGAVSGGYGMPVTLNGGVFSAGSLFDASLFQFASGTFRLTNSDFTVGAGGLFGSMLQLDSSRHLEITAGAITVDPGALLYLPGGSALGGGGIVNNGQIQLAGPTSLLSGGALTNNGTIAGSGRITNELTNSIGASVEASGADRLQFSGSANTNDGSISTFNGGRIDFAGSLLNSATGVIAPRGVLSVAGGLTNNGQMQFSAGVSDVLGSVTNTGRITVTGGNTTTFHDAVDTTIGSVTVNTNSTVVFLGNLIGQSNITGPGVKDFEADASGGPIATIVGDTLVGPAGSVSTDFFREDDLTLYGNATILPNGTAAHVSRVHSLSIAGGNLDVTNNDLIADTTPLTAIAGFIASGYHNGDWQGNGLRSSSAATSPPAHPTAVGYATASSIGVSSFDGQPVSGSNVLVRYTWSGDANLDGVVNALDFNALASNFGGASDRVWNQGDFNYDGLTNTLDFNALSINFNQPAFPSPPLGTLTPEPISLVFAALLPLLRRRRPNR